MEKATNPSATMVEQSLTSQQHFWLAHVQTCQSSKKGMAEYARDHGLKVKSFYYWKKRLVRLGALELDTQSKPPVFHKVRVQPTLVLKAACRIRFPNGIECELSHLEETGLAHLLVTVSQLQPQ
jgi:hypothetical protein